MPTPDYKPPTSAEELLERCAAGGAGDPLAHCLLVATRRSRSPRMSSICANADRRSSAISCASTFGSGRFALSSRDSSRSHVRSRLTLSRAMISS